MKEILINCEGFEWDKGNSDKNWICHHVAQGECEQVFFNEPVVVSSDVKHSQTESRWYVLGKTDAGRFLFLVFTIRKNKIRIISARDMIKKRGKSIMSGLKKIPTFKREDEEREFWSENDSSEFLDWSKSEKVILPKLKPTTKTISLRLPKHILDEIKVMANKRDVPYQSLIKLFLKDRLNQELKHSK